MTFIKEHPIYNLPTSMTDNLGQHSQGLVHLLRVRVSALPIIEAWLVNAVCSFLHLIVVLITL